MAVNQPDASIADSLFNYLKQLVTDPQVKFSYPGVVFTPTPGVPYLGAQLLPNGADAVGLEFSAPIQYQGLLQVSVFWPKPEGIIKPLAMAGTVQAYFKRGTQLWSAGVPTVKIDTQPRIGSPIFETAWTQVPITIAWRAVAPAST